MKASIPLVVLGSVALGIGLVLWNQGKARDGAGRLPLPNVDGEEPFPGPTPRAPISPPNPMPLEAERAPVTDVRAESAATMEIVVANHATGEPLPDLRVFLTPGDLRPSWGARFIGRVPARLGESPLTDDQGIARFEVPSGIPLRVNVLSARIGAANVRLPTDPLLAGEHRSVTAEIEIQARNEPKIEPVMIPWNPPPELPEEPVPLPPARVTVHFVHPDGSPYTDLLVTLQEDLWGTSGFPEETLRVGSDGACDFENLEPNRPYYLMLQRGSLTPEVLQWCDDHPVAVEGIEKGIYLLHDVLTRKVPSLVLDPEEDGERVVVIEDGVDVYGKVVHADGSPASVMLEIFPAGDEPADWHEIHSGPDGRFRIGDIGPGSYEIRANEDGASTELTIVPGRRPSRVFLELSSLGP